MIGHEVPLALILPLLALAGAAIGRFLNICIERFPEYLSLRDQLKSVVGNWQICRRCSARPSLRERLPFLSWLSGGRCHACTSRLPWSFPIIEAITATMFVLVYWHEIPTGAGATIQHGGLSSMEGPQGPEQITSLSMPVTWLHLRYVLHMVMICGLIVATEIDRRLRIIPDGATVPIMLFAVVAHTAFGQLFLVPIWFQDASTVKTLQYLAPGFLQPVLTPWDPATFVTSYPHLHGFLVSLVGAVVGGGTVWIVRQIGYLTLRQEAMGFGDVVLMAMVGSVIGWQPAVAVFIVGAPVMAIFFAIANWLLHGDNEIPYGPFLSAAAIVLLLTWPVSWPFAKRFFDMGPLLILMAVAGIASLAASLILVRFGKRILGFTGPTDFHDSDDWSSADHLLYYNSERPDEQTGQWQTARWPGALSGRGLQHASYWKSSHQNSSR